MSKLNNAQKTRKPFYRKWWAWLIASVVVLFIFVMSQPATEEYKADASAHSFSDYVDGHVSGSTKVEVTGSVSNTGNETLILEDDEGIYYIKNEDATNTKLNEGDTVKIWGVYVGNDAETGFPKIVAKLIEVN